MAREYEYFEMFYTLRFIDTLQSILLSQTFYLSRLILDH